MATGKDLIINALDAAIKRAKKAIKLRETLATAQSDSWKKYALLTLQISKDLGKKKPDSRLSDFERKEFNDLVAELKTMSKVFKTKPNELAELWRKVKDLEKFLKDLPRT